MRSANTSPEPATLPESQPSDPSLDPILDAAPAGYLSIDDAGMVRRVNATFAQLVGRARVEIEGRHIDELLPAAGRIFYSTHLFPMLRLHGHAEELFMPLLGADGTTIPVALNGARRRDDGDARYDLVVMPMRERNQLEDKLIAARNAAREAAGAKDRFLSIVSHELRTPITGVSGYADLLLRERAGPLTERQRRYVERIRDAAAYQVDLIADILEFAAIVGEQRPLQPAAVPIEDILVRAESMLAIRAREDGRAIKRQPRPAPGVVRADAGAVQQILLNLGVNAIKFSPRGSEITVRVATQSDRVRMSVTDAGAGIPADERERIFEPFVQLPGAELSGRRGVGLGLAISRDLARAMGGDITVESALGRGSTFTLELPAAAVGGLDA
jgi:PAS domain S-box-containing protein